MIRTVKWCLLGMCVFAVYASSILLTRSADAAQAMTSSQAHLEIPVLNGIDVLEKNGFRQLEDRRIGLITNQTGINRKGISDIQLFHEAQNVNLVAIFSPEHGLLGKLDIESIENSKDSLTGIEVFSLYGSTRTPTAAMLGEIDTLVFDIQDIGTRFYTYISTMGEAMQAAAEHGTRFVVLDRPNPINGVTVSGPVLDAGSESFVGFHQLPVRHGMTIGELALMFNVELELGLDLEIIRVEGWQRQDFFDTTGLQWINPSPNMRSLSEAILYPGIGLLETTNLSVGRGTSSPFELIGAPWLDGQQLATELNHLGLPGISFEATQFTPVSSKFETENCSGVNFFVTDRDQFNSVRTGIEIALKLRSLYPTNWETEKLNRLLGNAAVHQAILDGQSYAQIEMLFLDDLAEFMKRRARHLIYP
jgi:uncharacterized protein YbbC (DUF1343 family)